MAELSAAGRQLCRVPDGSDRGRRRRGTDQEVPLRENACQGGSCGRQYPKDGTRFPVAIVHPEHVAAEPFAGVDVAREKGLC